MIEYKFLTKEEFHPILKEHRDIAFSHSTDIPLESYYSKEEQNRSRELQSLCSTQYRIYLTAWDGDKIAGWSWGYQVDGKEFYTCNSAVMPAYRRQGIYSTLAQKVVEKATQDGFMEITSKHHADNNAVLIPKLKAGFVIKGFEINPRFGLMVNLVRYTNPGIMNIHQLRVGSRKQP
jgi:ribosomal protein S18 acetylase RimI-like enzyme